MGGAGRSEIFPFQYIGFGLHGQHFVLSTGWQGQARCLYMQCADLRRADKFCGFCIPLPSDLAGGGLLKTIISRQWVLGRSWKSHSALHCHISGELLTSAGCPSCGGDGVDEIQFIQFGRALHCRFVLDFQLFLQPGWRGQAEKQIEVGKYVVDDDEAGTVHGDDDGYLVKFWLVGCSRCPHGLLTIPEFKLLW